MSSLTITSDYVLQPEQTLTFTAADFPSWAGTAILLDGPSSSQDPSFTDEGAVSITFTSLNGIGTIYGIQELNRASPTSSFVTIAQGGSFSLTIYSLDQVVIGYMGQAPFENDGSFSARTSGEAFVTGVKLTGGPGFVNTGTFTVAGDQHTPATGVVADFGTLRNSGSMQASGAGATVFDIGGGAIINSGSITAVPQGIATGAAITIEGVAASAWTANPVQITNSGTISDSGPQVYAIHASDSVGPGNAAPTYSQAIRLDNSGLINGNVALGSGPPASAGIALAGVIHNTGAIHGAVLLSANGDNLYDGRGGTQTGLQVYARGPIEDIVLGGGVDTIYLGDDGETVTTRAALGHPDSGEGAAFVTGGAGDDSITSGTGNDVIDGGGGHNTLDGGAGINTWSFATATSGVTASLALQGTAQNSWGSTVDTASRFQNLTGSAFNDVLTGDANANVMSGGRGDDTLTGGGGADTFAFAPGGGQDVVADFSAAQGDRIDLSAYRAIYSFAQVQTLLTTSGGDTVLHLPDGAAVTLDNVSAASLTAADFIIGPRLEGDFNGDGMGDLFWQNTVNGMTSVWTLSDTQAHGASLPGAAGWQIMDVGDFSGGAYSGDILLRNATSGMVELWTDDNGQAAGADVLAVTLDWNIMAAADFNGDGRADILWRNTASGEIDLWTFDNGGRPHGAKVATLGSEWQGAGSGDFDGDGASDILWRNAANGQVVIWEMNGAEVRAFGTVAVLGTQWRVAAISDVNGDGKDDIVWRDSGTGQAVAWAMNGTYVDHQGMLGTVDASWQTINHHFDWA